MGDYADELIDRMLDRSDGWDDDFYFHKSSWNPHAAAPMRLAACDDFPLVVDLNSTPATT